MHDVGRQLRQAGITHDGHHEESRTALRVAAEVFQGQGELRGIHDGHEEGYGQHGIEADPATASHDHHTQQHVHQGVNQQHVLRTETHHQQRAYPASQEECQHVEAEEGGRRVLRQSGVGAAIHQEQAVDGRLTAVVEELRDDAPAQMRATEDAEINQFLRRPARFAFHVVAFLYLGQTGKDEHHGYDDEQRGQNDVRQFHGVGLHLDVAFPPAGIVQRKCLTCVGMAAEHQLAQEHGRDERAQAVERLCQIQTTGRRVRVAQSRHIGVGSRLQKAHAGGNDEEDAQVGPILLNHGSRDEEQSAASRQHQSEDDARLVAVTLHVHGYGDGEDEVGQPIESLGERCLEGVQFTGLHQLPNHGGQQIAADGPQEEEAEDERQGDKICVLFHCVVSLFLFRHVFDVRQFRQMLETIEPLGVATEEQGFVFRAQLVRLQDKVVRHAVGDGRDGARIVRTPHQLVHAHQAGRFPDGAHVNSHVMPPDSIMTPGWRASLICSCQPSVVTMPKWPMAMRSFGHSAMTSFISPTWVSPSAMSMERMMSWSSIR